MEACAWKDLRAVLATYCRTASTWELARALLACASLAIDVGRTSSDLPQEAIQICTDSASLQQRLP